VNGALFLLNAAFAIAILEMSVGKWLTDLSKDRVALVLCWVLKIEVLYLETLSFDV
jgi:hypothetical protein